MGAIQRRRGPNVIGFVGLLQAIADGLKLLVKEKMEEAVNLLSPLVVDIGEGINWLDAH